jgi:hypothetical protein
MLDRRGKLFCQPGVRENHRYRVAFLPDWRLITPSMPRQMKIMHHYDEHYEQDLFWPFGSCGTRRAK